MEQEIVEIKCRKTGKVLVTGPMEYRNQFCIGVIKTYPNGSKGGVAYLVSDVDVVTLS